MEKDLHLSINSEGIAELIFDLRDEKVNMLTAGVMIELNGIIDKIASDRSIRILIIKSAKPGIFIAGADIREIAGIRSIEEAGEKSGKGQGIMNKIEKLPFPSVCVIDGACLGGGLELALSCDYRIVSGNKKTKLGLPETTLGIMPGFGGTVRLPRLVGLKKALSMILTGKPVDGTAALKIKLADRLFPEAFLEDGVKEFVRKKIENISKKGFLRKRVKYAVTGIFLEGNPAGRALIFSASRKEILKKTGGFYPAPLKALETIRKNYGKKTGKALIVEREGFSKLAVTAEARHLIDIYFINEELKKAWLPSKGIKISPEPSEIPLAGVLGAGKMGGGIAWLFSNSDIPVRMKDISWNYIASGYKAIAGIYSGLQKIKKLDRRETGLKMHKVSGSIDYSGFSGAGIVIEAIVEDKDAKIKALKELESIVRDDAIIATNTSSFSVEELSSELKHPGRFLGFHFFNPVNRMPLIEVVKGQKTADSFVYSMVALARKLGKTPILVKDSNGFLVNRILMSYLNEALLMMEEGIDFTKIDKAVFNFGMPMGPFTLLDEIGIKVGYKVASILVKSYSSRFEPGKLYETIGSEGGLSGKASGKGFFIYKNGKKNPNPAIKEVLNKLEIKLRNPASPKEIVERCILRMINEASFCLEEGIIDEPGFLDMALILGIGFPPFRGGLLKYADETGIENIAALLEKYENLYGKRFKPSGFLAELKNNKGRFYK